MAFTVEQIKAAAAGCEAFGDKVFVAEVARALGTSLDALAPTLVEAHRAGVLPMSRCDLVPAFHESVDQTPVLHLNGQFHFVRLHGFALRQLSEVDGMCCYARDVARHGASKGQWVAMESPRARQELAYDAYQRALKEHGDGSPEASAAWHNVVV